MDLFRHSWGEFTELVGVNWFHLSLARANPSLALYGAHLLHMGGKNEAMTVAGFISVKVTI